MVLSVWQIAKDTGYAYYFSRYASARETYKDAMEEYKSSGKLAAWKRDPEKPKRPLSGSPAQPLCSVLDQENLAHLKQSIILNTFSDALALTSQAVCFEF